MKVIQVVSGIGVEASGPSYSVPGLCGGLYANDVAVELHTKAPRPPREFPFPLVVYPWRSGCFKATGWAPALARGLREAAQTADVIHSNGLWMFPNVYPGWAVKGTRCKLVVAPRGALAAWSLARNRMRKRIFGWLFQNQVLDEADMFHATSEKECEEIRAAGYRQPVAVVPIGMDLPQMGKRRPEEAAGVLRRLVFFGRLHSVKAVDHLVAAWGQAATRFSDWELVVAGPDCGARHGLENLIAERRIPRVRFVGELNGSAKYDFLATADLCVLPSLTENFGVTVAEALACGTPVIASQGTPWAGLVAERAGWWVPVGAEPLARQLGESLALPRSVLREMGERGRNWIARDFSWAGVGAKMKAAYEWLMGRGEKPDFVVEY